MPLWNRHEYKWVQKFASRKARLWADLNLASKFQGHVNLVPRGRDPFGQRRGSGPLARWDFESANRGLPVTLRRIKSKTQDGGEKWSRYVSGRRKIWIRKSWKSKYYTQTETRRDPQNNRFEAKRCFSRSPNWLRKIVNISNNATLDRLYGFWPETNPKEVYCLGGVTAQCLDKGSGNEVKAEWSESV